MHSDAARTVPRQDVCLSVCHKLVFCLNGYYPHFFRSWVAVASEPVEKWDGSTASASPPLSSLLPSPLLLFPSPFLSSPLPSPPLPLEVGPLKSS